MARKSHTHSKLLDKVGQSRAYHILTEYSSYVTFFCCLWSR
jgi:hypothetical protein